MTDTLASLYPDQVHQSTISMKRRAARRRSEIRFRLYGITAIGVAVLALAILLGSMVGSGLTAFWQHNLKIDLILDEQDIDPKGTRDASTLRGFNYRGMFRDWLTEKFPNVEDRRSKLKLYGLLSSGAPVELRSQVMSNPALLGSTITVDAPLSDDVDMFLKGKITDMDIVTISEPLKIVPTSKSTEREGQNTDSTPFADITGQVELRAASQVFNKAYLTIKRYYENAAEDEEEKAEDFRRRTHDIKANIDVWHEDLISFVNALTDQGQSEKLNDLAKTWQGKARIAVEMLFSHYSSAQSADDISAHRSGIDTDPVEPFIQEMETALDQFKSLSRTATSAPLPEARVLRSHFADLLQLLSTAVLLEANALDLRAQAADLEREEKLTSRMPSFLVETAGGAILITSLSQDKAEGEVLLPLSGTNDTVRDWSLIEIETPVAGRRVTDKEIVWIRALQKEGLVKKDWNSRLLLNGDSREPEMAGILGAVVGSFWTMLVTLVLSFPVAILTAVYLEEFAPKNRLTDFIEVNINNLAAVPSIVFGLLGLAVFINVFGLPRSAPLVGGMVLALMTLPTIIIAARASLKAVPPSIREAAIGVGASPLQTVFHHVLPLAMPGILTGTIIGMAQALGETAPLLMIGMVAFVADVPQGITSPSAALPVQIFLWADSAERAFVERTSAAILILLTFLIAMNLLAVLLRRHFERRW